MATISFTEEYSFDDRSIKLTVGTVGIYFIYLDQLRISYPFGNSRLIYIGLSESKQNSIGRRLYSHLTGLSGNLAIKNYAEKHRVKFTFHTFQLLRNLGASDLYEIESFFLKEFLGAMGAFPICNNQAGVLFEQPAISVDVAVDWRLFD